MKSEAGCSFLSQQSPLLVTSVVAVGHIVEKQDFGTLEVTADSREMVHPLILALFGFTEVKMNPTDFCYPLTFLLVPP